MKVVSVLDLSSEILRCEGWKSSRLRVWVGTGESSHRGARHQDSMGDWDWMSSEADRGRRRLKGSSEARTT